jgi:hypothetical protein
VLETLEGRIERTLIDVEPSAGDLLDAKADAPPVHGLEGKRLEDQEVDAAAECVGLLRVTLGHGQDSSLEVEKSIGRTSLEVKRNYCPL